MSPAVEISKLDAREEEYLRNLLNYTEQHPEGWTLKPNSTHEYSHEDIRPIIQPIIQKILIRITGDSRNLRYYFDVGDLIPIAGERYTISDGQGKVKLELGEKGHIVQRVGVQVQENCTLYLLWVVNMK
ncbi:hypothetical protein CRV24_000445 [Beauveria bassiana]|nr:hypothetical protein CRV24_000445 [Beauveria bassiana]